MSLEVEATCENGVLKLDKPLDLQEHERVTVHVKPHVIRIWQKTGDELKWTGDRETLIRIAEDPELRTLELP